MKNGGAALVAASLNVKDEEEIVIHRYKSGGFNIVLDVNSGGVHVVDDMTYDLVGRIEADAEAGMSDDELKAKYEGDLSADEKEALEELLSLRADDMLFSKDIYEPYIDAFLERETVVKAMCLHIAHDCNLGCKYCFAGEGEYHGDRGMMSFEVGKKALDYLVEHSGTRKNLEVDFFGGEPLLNFDVVKQLVAYGRSIEKEKNKNFRFTLTTNGTLLTDEILEFANKEMGNLVLSIDGRKSVHDNMRPYRGGKTGSYDKIVPIYQKAAESRKQMNYYVRGTYTHYNTDFAADVLHMADLGFKQISVEPVVAPPEEPYALTLEDIPTLCKQYDILADEMLKRKKEGKGFNFFHFMIDLAGGPCVAKRLSGCGSGCEYVAVTPWGDFYPCHQFVGEEEFLLGNVDDGIVNKDLQKKFHACNVYSKEACRNCFAKFYCSGGCAANAYHFHGNINSAYEIGCELERKRVECAIMLKVAENAEETEE